MRDGIVSMEGARLVYRVALDPQTLAVDDAQTVALRAAPANGDVRVVVDEDALAVRLVQGSTDET